MSFKLTSAIADDSPEGDTTKVARFFEDANYSVLSSSFESRIMCYAIDEKQKQTGAQMWSKKYLIY